MKNIESGLWSGIYASENPDTEIKQIIIADLEDFTAEALLLIKKFGEGYIPE